MLKNHLIDDVVCEVPVCEYRKDWRAPRSG